MIKDNNPTEKWARNRNTQFIEREIQETKKEMKSQKQLVITEMQINTCYCRLANIRKLNNAKFLQRYW